MIKFDAKNKRIIGELVKDARIPLSQLAKNVRLSRQMVKQRMDALVHENVIRAFETRLHYEAMGLVHYESWFSFRDFVGQTKKDILTFLIEHPFTRWVGECITTYNMRVTWIVLDEHHMEQIITEIHVKFGEQIDAFEVLSITGIAKHIPHHLTEEEFVDRKIEIRKSKSLSIDAKDVDILEYLSFDPRIRYVDLAKKVGLTLEGVRQRVKRLEQEEIILHYSANVDPRAINRFWMILLVNFATLDSRLKNTLAEFTRQKAYAGNSYTLLGNWHYHMTINADSLNELATSVSDFEASFTHRVKRYLPALVTKSHKYPKVPKGIYDVLRKQVT